MRPSSHGAGHPGSLSHPTLFLPHSLKRSAEERRERLAASAQSSPHSTLASLTTPPRTPHPPVTARPSRKPVPTPPHLPPRTRHQTQTLQLHCNYTASRITFVRLNQNQDPTPPHRRLPCTVHPQTGGSRSCACGVPHCAPPVLDRRFLPHPSYTKPISTQKELSHAVGHPRYTRQQQKFSFTWAIEPPREERECRAPCSRIL